MGLESGLPCVKNDTFRQIAEEIKQLRWVEELEVRLKKDNKEVWYGLMEWARISTTQDNNPGHELRLALLCYHFLETEAQLKNKSLPKVTQDTRNEVSHKLRRNQSYLESAAYRLGTTNEALGSHLLTQIPKTANPKNCLSAICFVYEQLYQQAEADLNSLDTPSPKSSAYYLPFSKEDYSAYSSIVSCTPEHGPPGEMSHMHSLFFTKDVPLFAARTGRVLEAVKDTPSLYTPWDTPHNLNRVIVDHGDDTFGQYTHTHPEVESGQNIAAGEKIGVLKGYAFQDPHLHFGVWQPTKPGELTGEKRSRHIDFYDPENLLFGKLSFEYILRNKGAIPPR
ncbi:MAG: M23 family metallopeptidase [Nanoarchaeota archaeon]